MENHHEENHHEENPHKEKIDWIPLSNVASDTSGVYLIEWSDGTVKYGRSKDVRKRVRKHRRRKERVSSASAVKLFAAELQNPVGGERVIRHTLGVEEEWLTSGEWTAKQIRRVTQGKEVEDKPEDSEAEEGGGKKSFWMELLRLILEAGSEKAFETKMDLKGEPLSKRVERMGAEAKVALITSVAYGFGPGHPNNFDLPNHAVGKYIGTANATVEKLDEERQKGLKIIEQVRETAFNESLSAERQIRRIRGIFLHFLLENQRFVLEDPPSRSRSQPGGQQSGPSRWLAVARRR